MIQISQHRLNRTGYFQIELNYEEFGHPELIRMTQEGGFLVTIKDNYTTVIFDDSVIVNSPPNKPIFWAEIFVNGKRIQNINELLAAYQKVKKNGGQLVIDFFIPSISTTHGTNTNYKKQGSKVRLFLEDFLGVLPEETEKIIQKRRNAYLNPSTSSSKKEKKVRCRGCGREFTGIFSISNLDYICTSCVEESDFKVKPNGPGKFPQRVAWKTNKILYTGRRKRGERRYRKSKKTLEELLFEDSPPVSAQQVEEKQLLTLEEVLDI